jgi:uncharacterized DUF497 family protein
MRWTWDPKKDRANKRDHGLSFETAQLVFDDPLAVSRLDDDPDESRWQTVGRVGGVTILVVHTWPEFSRHGTGTIGRIISARKATAHERKAYEEGEF